MEEEKANQLIRITAMFIIIVAVIGATKWLVDTTEGVTEEREQKCLELGYTSEDKSTSQTDNFRCKRKIYHPNGIEFDYEYSGWIE